jgi:DNA invertase Pin-like site-specific DNA recombinase
MGGMKYGYARTSTDDQTTALQLAALRTLFSAHSIGIL